ARSVNIIHHPNIVDIYEFGELPDGRPFFVMEFLEGMDLSAYLKKMGRLTSAETLGILKPLCAALAAAHRMGFVHRDIKPSNVFLARPATESARVVLIDFGIAKALEDRAGSSLTTSQHMLGTPICMSPEQIQCRSVDARTDVYGVGALAFQLLTGRPAFEAASPAVSQYLLLHGERPRPSQFVDVAPAIDEVTVKAMAIEPADRYSSVTELLDAFSSAVTRAESEAMGALQELPTIGLYVE